MASFSLGAVHPQLDPLGNPSTLELGDRGQNMQLKAASRRCGIDPLMAMFSSP